MIIGIVNQKGGVGKTTTSFNLANALSIRGKRVLVIDLDPQGSLTIHAGVETVDENDVPLRTIADVFRSRIEQKEINIRDMVLALKDVDIIPADITLSGIDLILPGTIAREYLLRRSLEPIKNEYDYIILDCSPSLSQVTFNALTAADGVIIPCKAEFLDLRGVELLLQSGVYLTQNNTNPNLKILGILITMFNGQLRHSKRAAGELSDEMNQDIPVFKTRISKTVKAVEASENGVSIFDYAPTSSLAKEYMQLAQEVMKHGNV